MRAGRWLDDLRQDTRYAARLLRRSPGFTLAVVLTLAFGIGANTAVFSLVNALLLQRLPAADPDRLVLVADPSRGSDLPPGVPNLAPFMWSYRMWDEIRRLPELFERAGGFFYSRFDLASGGESELVDGIYVSGAFFQTLGVAPMAGRTLTDADDRREPGADRAAVIGYDFWQQRFGGAPDIVGRALDVERLRFTIVGVLPRGFVGPAAGRAVDVAVPIAAAEEIRGRGVFEANGANWITILARLKRGQTIDAAAAALRGVQPQIRDATRPPPSNPTAASYLSAPLMLLPASRGNILDPLRVRARRPLLTMQIAVALLLVVVCANVANLLLARAVARRREMSVRLALGASRRRIASQLLVESLILSLAGAAAAVPLSRWALRVLLALFSPTPLALDVSPDARVLAFTTIATIAAAVVIGIVPAHRASRVAPIDWLREHDGNAAGGRLRLAGGFVVAQVAISLVLIVGGGLLIRTYANLATLELGFDPGGVLIVDVGMRKAHVPPANRLAVFERVRHAAETVPGVVGAAMADLSPVTGAAMAGDVEVVGRPSAGATETFVNRIGPGWLSLYGTSILAGRDFTPSDRGGALPVAIVNQAFVRRFFTGTDALGQVVRQKLGPPGRPPQEWTVVGITADAVYDSLRAPVPPTMYVAFDQIDDDLVAVLAPMSASMSVRVAGGQPIAVRRSLAAAIAKVNPELNLTIRPLTQVVNGSVSLERTLALLAGCFGALSLVLAAIGLYGVTSYEVAQRRREIGIRMALGATRHVVVRDVLSRVVPLVGVGIAIGAGVSAWASQFVGALLFRLPARDPLTFVGAAAVLAVVAALAGWLPARRASRLDPMISLRHE